MFLNPLILTPGLSAFSARLLICLLCSGLSFHVAAQTHTIVSKTVLENLGPNVNSGASEIHPVISADGKTLYFVRDSHVENYSTQDVWFCEVLGSGWGPAVHPRQPLNYRGKSSGISNVSTDNNQLLVRGAFEDGEYTGSGLSVIEKNKKGEWKDPKKLEIVNFSTYSNMGNTNNSVLTPDGKHLLFAFSDASNGNRHELYVSHLVLKDKWHKPSSIKDFTRFVSKALNNNTWTEPQLIKSLSAREFNEFAPFMAADGVTLYYSSNKTGGFGDQDIWMAKRLDDTWQKWSEPVNLGNTINSDEWDAYYTLDARGEDAYMTSYKNSLGRSDIIKIKLVAELRPNPVILITGKVYNAKTKEPLGASIEYENLVDGKNVGVAQSNPLTGEYKIVLPYGRNYGFMAYTDKFISVSDNLDLSAIAEYREITRDLYLVPLEVGNTIRLNNVFFDVNKSLLRAESYPELERLAGLMSQNSKMQIELSGHTDNAGSDEANLKLSDDRVKSVYEYMISLGVNAERLKYKGYGETKPVATNDSEEGRQQNRRVEFAILKN
ncbi:MAG: OmpA family protein [Bacteroidota bacterium]